MSDRGRLSDTAPNRLHESSFYVLPGSRDANGVGMAILNLQTDGGLIEVAINKTVAEMLCDNLNAFLDGEDGEAV